jgi:hypothetical protein
MINNINKYIYTVLALIIFLSHSCKEYRGPDPIFEEYIKKEQSSKGRHVLMIVVDGAVGKIVEDLKLPTIESLLDSSKYTFDGLSENVSTDITSWTSLMTGTSYNTHKVVNDGFRPSGSLDDPHNSGSYYPSAFYRLLENRPDFETVAITSWPSLANNFLAEATHLEIVEDDDKATVKAGKYLLENDPKLTVVNYRQVLTAGLATGFSKENADYVGAIQNVDTQIGKLLSVVKSRPNYNDEQWLIVVTSSAGGKDRQTGGSSLEERNTFALFYNKFFKPLKLETNVVNSVRFHGWDGLNGKPPGVRAQAPDPAGVYNPKKGAMTIQIRVKFNKNANGNYDYFVPPFLSKINNRSGSTIGWSMLRNSGQIEWHVADGTQTISLLAPNVGIDGNWTTVTTVINTTGGKYLSKIYIDGLMVNSKEMISNVELASPAPLVMGYWPTDFTGVYVDMQMSDLRIWNTMLSDEEIAQNVCYTEVLPTHTNYNSLVGYWPANDGGANFFNRIANNPNFSLSGEYQYSLSSLDTKCEKSKANFFVQNHAIIPQIYYWLRVDPHSSWGVEGTRFLDRFEVEFIK